MAKYGGFVYRGSYYGEIPRLPFSVEPFKAIAVDYDKVYLYWGPPQGEVNGLRLVRNQDGYGEWPEDGVVLFERTNETGDFGDTFYIDGEDNFVDENLDNDIPLVPGRFTYYRMWVRRTSTNLWSIADDIVVVLPKQHGTITPDGQTLKTTHENFMDLLPRVYTSKSQSPLDAVDTESDLYRFLQGFSFTLDEMLTLADLLIPDFSGRSTNPQLLSLQVNQYGITPASDDVILRQKRMVREALYMYSRKGTSAALSTLIEALTGFSPTIEQSPNLFLSNQDSTFNNSLGYWKPLGDCVLSSTNSILVPSGEDFQIDNEFCAKVVTSSINSRIVNGLDKPVTRGIPVVSGTSYRFSFFAQRTAATGMTVVPQITWHNGSGDVISTVEGTPATTTVSWANYGVTAVAPGTNVDIINYTVTSNVVTLTTSGNHTIPNGSVISLIGMGIPFDGKHTISATTASSISFPLVTGNVSITDTVAVVSTEKAVYATVGVKFNNVSTVYLDMMQFAQSSVTDYYEARSVQVFLSPSKSNFVNDPSFSAITTDWTIAGGTEAYPASTLPYMYAGDSMLALTTGPSGLARAYANTNTGGMPVGKFYTFSVYCQVPSGLENVYLRITAVDSVNTSIVKNSTPVEVNSTWTRLSVTTYVPANFVSDSLYFTLEARIDSSNGLVVNFDAAQLEPTYAATDYIDGSFPTEYGLVWEGLTNDSPSHLYKNKQAKVIRIIQELENFLPSNTPYVVSSFGGVETKAITM